jgi:alanyl aminopeptidase
MKNNNMVRSILCTAFLSAVLAACSGPDDAPGPAATQPQQAGDEMDAPVGRLGDNVVPTKYAIELTIDPSQDTFSGRVSIDVQISEPTSTIWMHGKDLDISRYT